MDLRRSLRPVMKMVLATGVMTAVCLLVRKSPLYPAATGRAGWAGQLALIMAVGAAAYLATCAGLGVDTMKQLLPGKKDKAISALALYLTANPARAVGFDDEHNWQWRSIHDDPRFQALVVRPRQ